MRFLRKLDEKLKGRSAIADGSVLILLVAAWAYGTNLLHPHAGLVWGCDFTLYQQTVQNWMSGGSMYPAYQLGGPYEIQPGAILYPPITIAAFAPTLLLPGPLWWLIPIVVTGAIVLHLRPRPWAILTIGFCLLYTASFTLIVAGNPDMWLVAALAIALYWRPAAAFVLLKPSLFPFALIGVKSKGWWVIAGLFTLVSLAFIPQTFDWIKAVTTGYGPRSGVLYSLQDAPLLLVPFVAWFGSKARHEAVATRLAELAPGDTLQRGPLAARWHTARTTLRVMFSVH